MRRLTCSLSCARVSCNYWQSCHPQSNCSFLPHPMYAHKNECYMYKKMWAPGFNYPIVYFPLSPNTLTSCTRLRFTQTSNGSLMHVVICTCTESFSLTFSPAQMFITTVEASACQGPSRASLLSAFNMQSQGCLIRFRLRIAPASASTQASSTMQTQAMMC